MMKSSSGVVVVGQSDLAGQTAQTEGLPRLEGVSPERTGSSGLWMGRVTGPPGMDSGPHHHGDAETGGYVLKGAALVFFGEDYGEHVELHEGDFIYVPAFVPHIERNLSSTESVEFVTCRFPGNIVVNLDLESTAAGIHVPSSGLDRR
jgi:uncharacterized RmlC-like cupin family protein